MRIGALLIILGAFIILSRLDAFLAYAEKLLKDQEQEKDNLIVPPKAPKQARLPAPAAEQPVDSESHPTMGQREV